MSSLLQFRGKVDKDGVHIEVYKVDSEPWYKANWENPFICTKCGREHPILYTFARKPKGMFGQWVVFQYNGEKHVPDLSCPFGMFKLPRDAKAMTQEQSEEAWHK